MCRDVNFKRIGPESKYSFDYDVKIIDVLIKVCQKCISPINIYSTLLNPYRKPFKLTNMIRKNEQNFYQKILNL